MPVAEADASPPLKAPFPWFGGKSMAAPILWRAFGNTPNYVEPFCGSMATLLARPHAPKVETVNDKDGLIANFWRAVKLAPEAVAEYADWPVNEADLHARHIWLVREALPLVDKLIADPDWYDAKVAGWWVWGICSWIGNGWCSRDERLQIHRSMPNTGAPGHGIHAPSRKKPLTHRNKGVHADGAPEDLFARLSARLRDVRVCCGEWKRVLGRSTLGIDTAHGMTPCAVLLDPPFSHDEVTDEENGAGKREKRLYREDDPALSGEVRAWALEHGENPDLRIALCGWAGEHDMPGWKVVRWKGKGSGKNRGRERIWLSPHCLSIAEPHEQRELFT